MLNDINAIKVMVEGFLLTLCAKFLSIQITSWALAVQILASITTIESSGVYKRSQVKATLD